MQIFVQKLSNPLEEWAVDVESSDTILGVKQKLQDFEPSYVAANIKLFFDSIELNDGSTLSDYGIQKNNHITSSYGSSCEPIFEKFAYLQEDGCKRFKRLRLLGYL